MSLDNLAIFRALDAKMNWLGQRQKVIAGNVSNADTPSYRPQDIEEFDFKAALRGSAGLARTDSSDGKSKVALTQKGHMYGSTAPGDSDVSGQRKVYEAAPVGNSVIIEEQMIRASKTAMEYQAMTNLYKKHFDMMMTALGRGQ